MSIIDYIKETRAEFVHVNWPSREALIWLTISVLLVTAIVAAYLGALDFLFTRFIKSFIA
jgi:preprotein translocase SecE subunit